MTLLLVFCFFFACFVTCCTSGFMQVFSVTLPRFYCFSWMHKLVLSAARACCVYYLGQGHLVCGVVAFFRCFFDVLSSFMTFLVFMATCMHYKTRAVCTFGVVFILFSCSPRAPASNHPHPNPPLSICTHLRTFEPNLQKHHVRGNFPGHRSQILVCKTLNTPRLPCFCVSRAPRAPTHPSTPIRTHFHLFSPVRTLYFMYICII